MNDSMYRINRPITTTGQTAKAARREQFDRLMPMTWESNNDNNIIIGIIISIIITIIIIIIICIIIIIIINIDVVNIMNINMTISQADADDHCVERHAERA